MKRIYWPGVIGIIVIAVLFAPLRSALIDAHAATSAAPYFSERGVAGSQVIVTTTDPVFLTVPPDAQNARIYVKDNPVCYSLDGSVPGTNSPGEWPAGYLSKEENDRGMLQALRIQSCAEGSATFKIVYTRRVPPRQ